MSDSHWCTIESDPAVFTELIERIGVKGIAVEELFALDPSFLEQYATIYGLIFLFKFQAGLAPSGTVVRDAPVYFASQVIQDACASIAIVNTLCNFPDAIDLGDQLKNFLSFTEEMDPELRGSQIAEFEPLRTAHNSFAPPQSFEMDAAGKSSEDVYHFVSFIFRNGSVWELDGLQSGPIRCADATPDNYKTVLTEVVQKYISEISERDTQGKGQGISFTLMAVVDDPIKVLEDRIAALRAEERPVAELEAELKGLKETREMGHKENVRRRHNYNPMIVTLLKALAEKGVLQDVLADLKSKK